jgi:glycosyltransferase involved in cell wall biosynthesis
MRLLIVNLHLDIGGVETLLVRLIPMLATRGVSVTLVLLENRVNGEFASALTPFCTIKFINDAFPFSRAKLRSFFGGEFDVAFFTISQALIFGSWMLHRAGYSNTKTVLGAYQTEIFCPEAEWWQYHRLKVRRILASDIDASAIIFGNTAGRDFHATRLGISLQDSTIIQLFVDVGKYEFKLRPSLRRTRVVSIGRVTEYKTYNFTLLPVFKQLREEGHDVEWHIYGDGEQLRDLELRVSAADLASVVFVHGALNYSKFQSVLDDAFLYIGGGTTLIEAAACGVPSLTTIEYAPDPVSYGFISEIAGHNLIEPGMDKRTCLIKDRIVETLNCSPDEYLDLQHACYQKALSYSSESIVDEYVAIFQKTAAQGSVVRVRTWQILLYCVAAGCNHFLKKLGRMKKK